MLNRLHNRRTVLRLAAVATALAATAMLTVTALAEEMEIAVIPKLIGIPYFASTGVGAAAAGEELGIKITYNGPTDASTEGQINIVNQAIRRGVDAIAIAPLDTAALAPSLKRAQKAGIPVVTWDTDADVASRAAFVTPVSYAAMSAQLVESLARDGVTEGPVVQLIAAATSENMIEYQRLIKAYMAEHYPDMEVVQVLAGDDDAVKSKAITTSYLQGNPDTKAIIVTSAAMTPAIEAVKDVGLEGKVIVGGIGLPSVNGEQTKAGEISRFFLWNPEDLGYASVYLAKAAIEGKIEGAKTVNLGKLGNVEVGDDNVLIMAPPFEFNAENVDQFNF